MTEAERIATLPKLKHKIILTEEAEFIVLDISDETGGLGLKLFLPPDLANSLGARLQDRARFAVANASSDPKRAIAEEFFND